MNIGDVSFFTGILLLFIGILGGGIEVKELKIPQITGTPRYACFIGSLLLLILGLQLKHELPDFFNRNANNFTAFNGQNTPIATAPEIKAPVAPVTTPAVAPAQQVQAQPVAPVNTPSENAILAKQQALINMDAANKRLNFVWNSTTQDIRDDLLPEQAHWLKQREETCSLKALNEQPADTVMQETVKLTCMTAMSDPRMEELKQKITEITQSIVIDEPEIAASNLPDSETAKRQAQTQLDEANNHINTVWNATTKEIRLALLPEQRQWLKQREDDCSLKASNEQPVDNIMQEAVKLTCMAIITAPRTEALKQKIAAMSQ